MSDSGFILQNFTKAVVESKSAVHLLEQKSRLEQALCSSDTALTLDIAKSLLEALFKTIISDYDKEADLSKVDFKDLNKRIKKHMRLNSNDDANVILEKLISSVVHNLGELRNKYGAASHGKDGYFNNPIKMPEAEMIAQIVDGVSGFILTKHKISSKLTERQRIGYNEYQHVDDYLDAQNAPLKLPTGDMIPYSKIFFDSDPEMYRQYVIDFLDSNGEQEKYSFLVVNIALENIKSIFLTPVDELVFDSEDYEISKIPDAINHILGLNNGKVNYLKSVRDLNESNLINKKNNFSEKIFFFQAIEKFIIEYLQVEVETQLSFRLTREDLVEIFNQLGFDSTENDALSFGFLEFVKSIPHRYLAIEMFVRLLLDKASKDIAVSILSSNDFINDILIILKKYRTLHSNTHETLESLIVVAKIMRDERDKCFRDSKNLKLSLDELVFYSVFIQYESVNDTFECSSLRRLAKDVVARLRNNVTIDWRSHESMHAKLRTLLRRLLRNWKYPPHNSTETITLCLMHAEKLTENWENESVKLLRLEKSVTKI